MDRFPVDNWQFWIVTAAMLWGVWMIVRPFLPLARKSAAGSGASCPGCNAGHPSRPHPRKTALTIEGRNT